MQQVKIGELKKIIHQVYDMAIREKTYVATMIWGPPGIGKSAGVKQLADELGIGFIDLRLSLLNPVDLRGLPMPNKEAKTAEWLVPEFLPSDKHGKNGILFLDEVNLAPQSVMAAGYQLILDRRLGNYVVPEGWILVAAGNRAEDNASTTRMPAPLMNRMIHLEIPAPDVEEWRMWAIKHGVAEEIVAFISRFEQYLFQAPKAGDRGWCSPRSWNFASHLFKAGQRIDSAVGQGAASAFAGFLAVYKDLPDIDAILEGRETKLPDKSKLDLMWALTMALAYRTQPAQLKHCFAYMKKAMPKEFSALCITIMTDDVKMRAAIAKDPAWVEWVKENSSMLYDG